MEAASVSGSEADTTVKKPGSRVAKMAAMTLASVGLLIAAVVAANHAVTKPNSARIDQQRVVVFNNQHVHNGMLQRSQQMPQAAERALDGSVAAKNAFEGAVATETVEEDSNATAATFSATSEAKGLVKWATHPEFCFDIAGGRQESGTNLQIWHCNGTHEEWRQFTMPTSGEGPIHWAAHPEDCIDISGGKQHNGNNVQMWLNDCSHDNMRFIMPEGGRGPLRWALHPDKCIDIDGGKTGDATNIKLWDCEEGGEHPNQVFILPSASA